MSTKAIKLLKEKLAALQEQEAIETEAAQKFKLAKQIEETKLKIAELGANAPDQPGSLPRPQGGKTQIATGGALAVTSLLAALAEVTGHLNKIIENVRFLDSLPRSYLVAALAIPLIIGLSLLRRGLFARHRAPDARRLVIDPEKNPDQFVGRQADLQSLAQCLDEGQLVFLSGESGAGKSALIKVGLRDYLNNKRSDLRLLPIVVDSYGAFEDWDTDLSARLASRFFDSLTPEERNQLGFSDRTRSTKQLMDLLWACDSKLARVPLLVFDQFDDYQNLHRSLFLRDRKWITPETLVTENGFWRAIQKAVGNRSFKVLLVTRRDRFDSLDSLRLVPAVAYPLPGVESKEIGRLLEDLLADVGSTDGDLKALKEGLLNDLTDEKGEILPIQAALAFQGLASLDSLTTRQYRRQGGLRGLQIAHVRRGMLHFGQRLRLDHKTVCSFFRTMVDHGSPPKTIAVPVFTLAGQVKPDESQVLEQLRALAKPTFRIVRERIEATEAQSSEWSLYHDFLAPIVLEVRRQLDSANSLLEQRHAAFRSANGGWAKWTALLSPWESFRLAWAAVRHQVQIANHGRYCLASTLRLLPYIALGCTLWVGVDLLRDQLALREAQRVIAAMGAVDRLSAPPSGGELAEIEKLARAKWPVKAQFIRYMVQSPMTPDRFALRYEYLTHALVGIDPSRETRKKFLTILATAPLGRTSDSMATRGFWRARIFASDPERFTAEANLAGTDLVEAMRATIGEDQLGSLALGLAGLAKKIDPKLSAPLAEKIVEAMRATTNLDQLSSLAQGLAGLTEKVDPKLSARGAEKIVEAMRATTNSFQLSSLAEGLAGLAKKIDPNLSAPLAEKIVEAMRATTNSFQLSSLAEGLAGLAEKIDPNLSAPLAEKIVEAMRATTNSFQLWSLAAGLAGLAEKIDPKLSAQGAGKIVEAMRDAINRDQLSSLALGLFYLKQVQSLSNAQRAVDLLKWPLAVMSTGDQIRPEGEYPPIVTDCVLAYLGCALQHEPFQNINSFVEWAQLHPEAKLDLESVPDRP